MKRLYHTKIAGLGQAIRPNPTENKSPSKNHFIPNKFASEIEEQISSMGLSRVAGNVFICNADREFWTVKSGKIVRLVGSEVDAGQHIQAAPNDTPGDFLQDILGDLTW